MLRPRKPLKIQLKEIWRIRCSAQISYPPSQLLVRISDQKIVNAGNASGDVLQNKYIDARKNLIKEQGAYLLLLVTIP